MIIYLCISANVQGTIIILKNIIIYIIGIIIILYYIIIAITEQRARARHQLRRQPPGGACTRRLAPVQRHELGSPAPGLLHTSHFTDNRRLR